MRSYAHPKIPLPITRESVVTTKHTALIKDNDFFMHMNNCMYFRHAELARWEMLPRSGLLQAAIKNNWMFLAVRQDANYIRALPLFPLWATFEIRTSFAQDSGGKFIDFTHDFYKDDEMFASLKVRACIKLSRGPERGKTVKPIDLPDFFQL